MGSISVASTATTTLTQGVRKEQLNNGLVCLTKAIKTAPIVSVQIWYRVGARNEPRHLCGIAHQLEHLMFKGTQTRPVQFGRLFSAIGSASNAFTSYDMTAYYGTARRDQLATLLTLEADRMQNILIDPETLESERRVVISELQGYENSPSYRLGKKVMAQALGDHPYGLPVGGSKTDVERFSLEQVQNFHSQHYQPRNAVLVIAGDIDHEQTSQLVHDIFGRLENTSPPLPDQSRAVVPPYDSNQGEIKIQSPGSLLLIEQIYPTVNNQHPDVPVLDMMDSILTAGHQSRLHQALVETGLVNNISTYAANLMDGGWYDISISAAPDADSGDILSTLKQTLASMYESPISDAELHRARVQLTTQFILSNRDIDTQASQIAYNEITTGDYKFSDRYLERLKTVTAQDIAKVAKKYLAADRCTQGSFIPSRVNQDPVEMVSPQTQEDFGVSEPVDPKEVEIYLPALQTEDLPPSQVKPHRLVLDNGLRFILLPDHSSPTITLAGQLQAGNMYDQPGRGGVGILTAENITSGTSEHTELELAEILEARGVYLNLQSFREGVDIEGYALSEHASTLLETLNEVMRTAIFPEEKLNLCKARMRNHIKAELDDPGRAARRRFQQELFPMGHPFYEFPTLESIENIRREDILERYHKTYRPDLLVITLVGDFELEAMKEHLQNTFGTWLASGQTPTVSFPKLELPSSNQRIPIHLEGKTQVVTYLGHISFKRKDPRYYAALILNEIVGGDTLSSRLGNEIRDRQGLTYGIYSYFSSGSEVGSFIIEMQTAPEDTDKAIRNTLQLLRNLISQGIKQSEFETVQRSLLNAYPIEYASPDHVAQRLLLHEIDGLGLDEMQKVPQRIAAVTYEEVQGLIKELIHPDQMTIVNAGSLR